MTAALRNESPRGGSREGGDLILVRKSVGFLGAVEPGIRRVYEKPWKGDSVYSLSPKPLSPRMGAA